MTQRLVTLHRDPFFTVDGEWFLDLLFNHHEPLLVNYERLAVKLSTVQPESFVVGRRMRPSEVMLLEENRRTCDDEAYAAPT